MVLLRTLPRLSLRATPIRCCASSSSGWDLEPSWARELSGELSSPYFATLRTFVDEERRTQRVLPSPEQQFAAFDYCPFDDVRAVILGQDPYPTPGHAHGLCFSVEPGVAVPGSLRNIYKELASDVGLVPPSSGNLAGWAQQGVLLLNTVLTVRAGVPQSHAGQGWERLTDAAVSALSQRRRGVVFFLWGASAKKKAALIDGTRHCVLTSAHPSPLSAHRGFLGSRHFSSANAYLVAGGGDPIDWAQTGAVSAVKEEAKAAVVEMVGVVERTGAAVQEVEAEEDALWASQGLLEVAAEVVEEAEEAEAAEEEAAAAVHEEEDEAAAADMWWAAADDAAPIDDDEEDYVNDGVWVVRESAPATMPVPKPLSPPPPPPPSPRAPARARRSYF